MNTRFLATLGVALLATTTASAANLSFTGTFTKDNDKVAYTVALFAPGAVTFSTLGYAGGTNVNGAAIAQGGFDPILSLYGRDGMLIDENDDGAGVALDSDTGQGSDALLSLNLAAGLYTLVLTQYNNFGPIQLPGEFGFAGQPSFRDGFVDFYGSQRDGGWAIDLVGVGFAELTSVPTSASWMLLFAGAGLLAAARRR